VERCCNLRMKERARQVRRNMGAGMSKGREGCADREGHMVGDIREGKRHEYEDCTQQHLGQKD
jgi:hypothetical protein